MVKHIPAFRATIARELIEKYGMSQAETAKCLGVSQPAVSQYLSSTRGTQAGILQHPKVSSEIKSFCRKVSENEGRNIALEFCNFCKLIRSAKVLCPSCKYSNGCTGCAECF